MRKEWFASVFIISVLRGSLGVYARALYSRDATTIPSVESLSDSTIALVEQRLAESATGR